MNVNQWYRGDRQDFFIQAVPKGPWHVESPDNCEEMLCGMTITVDAPNVRIQYRWGPKKCPDCFMIYERRRSYEHRS